MISCYGLTLPEITICHPEQACEFIPHGHHSINDLNAPVYTSVTDAEPAHLYALNHMYTGVGMVVRDLKVQLCPDNRH